MEHELQAQQAIYNWPIQAKRWLVQILPKRQIEIHLFQQQLSIWLNQLTFWACFAHSISTTDRLFLFDNRTAQQKQHEAHTLVYNMIVLYLLLFIFHHLRLVRLSFFNSKCFYFVVCQGTIFSCFRRTHTQQHSKLTV